MTRGRKRNGNAPHLIILFTMRERERGNYGGLAYSFLFPSTVLIVRCRAITHCELTLPDATARASMIHIYIHMYICKEKSTLELKRTEEGERGLRMAYRAEEGRRSRRRRKRYHTRI